MIVDGDEDDEEITEYEYEKENKEVIEFEVEEGVKEVEEELTPPKVTNWIDPIIGKTMHGVMVITNDLNNPKKKRKYITCQFDDCTICYQPWTSSGDHQIWSACPHCKTICSSKDVKLLYVPRLCTAARQKADAKKLHSYALKQLTDIKRQHLKVKTHTELLSKWAAEWAQDDADARLANKLARLADALRRWVDSLELVTDAYTTRLDFFNQMCKEHQKRSLSPMSCLVVKNLIFGSAFVRFFISAIADLLSTCIVIFSSWECVSLLSGLFNHNACVAAVVAAMNSDSHDDSATVACFCVLQLIGD
nr:hypothetical protein [Tanacetum cinerariifolium]